MAEVALADVPTKEGKELIERWQAAIERLETAKREVNSADCAVRNATNALGRWLTPHDGVVGESFSIWNGDALITSTQVGANTWEIKVRSRGQRGSLRSL